MVDYYGKKVLDHCQAFFMLFKTFKGQNERNKTLEKVYVRKATEEIGVRTE